MFLTSRFPRTELLRSIGATNVHARPKPDVSMPGNFVVQGVWAYTEHNLGALRGAVATQRALYRERLDRIKEEEGPMRLLRRLKQWWTQW